MNTVLTANTPEQLLEIIDQVVRIQQHEGKDLTTKDKLQIILSESMQALALVTTIEDELDINFEDEDIDLDFFLDFDTMLERVQRHLDRKNPAHRVLTPAVMTDTWWDGFLSLTDNMTVPQVFKKAIPPVEVDNLKNQLVSAIRILYTFKKNDYGFRCYQDGKEKDKDFVLEHFKTYAPLPGEHLDEWAKRALEAQNIALIFNHVEYFSDLITQQLSMYIAPLIRKTGMPLNGMHTTIFIGNYPYTPLGIHQDLPGSNVIHLHLGDADKIMHTWEPEAYKKLAGEKPNNHRIEPLLPHASTFVIEKGDLYSMPWSKFHVGCSKGLSSAITIWFDNHANQTLVTKLLGHFKRNYFQLSDRQFTKPEKNTVSFPSAGELSDLIRLDPWQEHLDFKSLFREVAIEQVLLLLSNGGWREHEPFEQKEEGEGIALLSGKQIKKVEPFKIYTETKLDEYLLIYARGEKIVLGKCDEFIRIIELIDSGITLSVDELLHPIPDDALRDTAAALLSILYQYRAISITD